MAKKALVDQLKSFIHPDPSVDSEGLGYVLAETASEEFATGPDHVWKDCADDVNSGTHYWNIANSAFELIPEYTPEVVETNKEKAERRLNKEGRDWAAYVAATTDQLTNKDHLVAYYEQAKTVRDTDQQGDISWLEWQDPVWVE